MALSLLFIASADAFSSQTRTLPRLSYYSEQNQILFHKDTVTKSMLQQELGDCDDIFAPVTTNPLDGSRDIALVPLATDPLLCTSSQPILTQQECATLMEWCKQAEDESLTKALLAEEVDDNGEPMSEGAKILWKVQQYVHHELLGNDGGDYVVPRYLHYSCQDGDSSLKAECGMDSKRLLPDGLHVDTNGSQHFRHW